MKIENKKTEEKAIDSEKKLESMRDRCHTGRYRMYDWKRQSHIQKLWKKCFYIYQQE